MRLFTPVAISVFVLATAARLVAAEPAPTTLRSDWIDPDTGHRVIRLSPDTGGSSLYFHQNGYTPEGDKLVINTPNGIATVDLSTLGVSSPKIEMPYLEFHYNSIKSPADDGHP
jgi:oligogalacturonide lyase